MAQREQEDAFWQTSFEGLKRRFFEELELPDDRFARDLAAEMFWATRQGNTDEAEQLARRLAWLCRSLGQPRRTSSSKEYLETSTRTVNSINQLITNLDIPFDDDECVMTFWRLVSALSQGEEQIAQEAATHLAYRVQSSTKNEDQDPKELIGKYLTATRKAIAENGLTAEPDLIMENFERKPDDQMDNLLTLLAGEVCDELDLAEEHYDGVRQKLLMLSGAGQRDVSQVMENLEPVVRAALGAGTEAGSADQDPDGEEFRNMQARVVDLMSAAAMEFTEANEGRAAPKSAGGKGRHADNDGDLAELASEAVREVEAARPNTAFENVLAGLSREAGLDLEVNSRNIFTDMLERGIGNDEGFEEWLENMARAIAEAHLQQQKKIIDAEDLTVRLKRKIERAKVKFGTLEHLKAAQTREAAQKFHEEIGSDPAFTDLAAEIRKAQGRPDKSGVDRLIGEALDTAKRLADDKKFGLEVTREMVLDGLARLAREADPQSEAGSGETNEARRHDSPPRRARFDPPPVRPQAENSPPPPPGRRRKDTSDKGKFADDDFAEFATQELPREIVQSEGFREFAEQIREARLRDDAPRVRELSMEALAYARSMAGPSGDASKVTLPTVMDELERAAPGESDFPDGETVTPGFLRDIVSSDQFRGLADQIREARLNDDAPRVKKLSMAALEYVRKMAAPSGDAPKVTLPMVMDELERALPLKKKRTASSDDDSDSGSGAPPPLPPRRGSGGGAGTPPPLPPRGGSGGGAGAPSPSLPPRHGSGSGAGAPPPLPPRRGSEAGAGAPPPPPRPFDLLVSALENGQKEEAARLAEGIAARMRSQGGDGARVQAADILKEAIKRLKKKKPVPGTEEVDRFPPGSGPPPPPAGAAASSTDDAELTPADVKKVKWGEFHRAYKLEVTPEKLEKLEELATQVVRKGVTSKTVLKGAKEYLGKKPAGIVKKPRHLAAVLEEAVRSRKEGRKMEKLSAANYDDDDDDSVEA